MNYSIYTLNQYPLPAELKSKLDQMKDVFWAVSDVSDSSLLPLEGGLFFDGLALQYVWRERGAKPIQFEFDHIIAKFSHRPLSSLLARAIGKKNEHVLDATAGTGQDALTLLLKGHRVTSYERNPIIAALLFDAFRRMESALVDKQKWQICFGNFTQFEGDFDALYYDPMFDRTGKSALPRIEMELFHQLIGELSDDAVEVEWMKKHAKRVVVKRALKALPLLQPVTAQITGKSIRFDLHQLK